MTLPGCAMQNCQQTLFNYQIVTFPEDGRDMLSPVSG